QQKNRDQPAAAQMLSATQHVAQDVGGFSRRGRATAELHRRLSNAIGPLAPPLRGRLGGGGEVERQTKANRLSRPLPSPPPAYREREPIILHSPVRTHHAPPAAPSRRRPCR